MKKAHTCHQNIGVEKIISSACAVTSAIAQNTKNEKRCANLKLESQPNSKNFQQTTFKIQKDQNTLRLQNHFENV